MELKSGAPLAEHTSWLIGGPADYLVFPTTIEELKEAWKWAHERSLPITWLGGGSNVLISDKGIRGLVVGLKKMGGVAVVPDTKELILNCGAGAGKSELLKIFLKYKMAPALFLAGLPGDIGGGVVMNAGVSENMVPREFGEITHSFDVLKFDGENFELKTYQHDDVQWSYRHTKGWEPGVIVRAQLRWPLHVEPDILDKVKQANKVRLQKQPLDKPSCGSVFVNPEGHKAAQLIDSCSLKGTQVGDAQVSLKHANFIVNLGKAKAQDVWELIQKVQSTVLQKTGVKLKTEVIRLGDWS